MNRIITLYIFTLLMLSAPQILLGSETPRQSVLIGYWHNWENEMAPFLAPERLHSAYNIINIAFATPRNGTDHDMYFHPLIIKKDDFKSRLKQMQASGKKVILSLGGGNSPVTLDSTMEKNVFVQSVLRLLVDYEFDGIDVDFEGTSIRISGGTIKEPQDSSIILLISAIKEIMAEYHNHFNRKAILCFAPETAYVQGGQSGYGGMWGAYLPLLDALRDSIDYLSVQLYNSGAMYGLDWGVYHQATPDFIVAMTEKLITGFNTKGGFFEGFPASKITVGLPACNRAAGGGYTMPDSVEAAINYLIGKSKNPPGSYKLRNENAYPDLAGMMTWSVNWDASDSCAVAYEYADTFERIFGSTTSVLAAAEPIKPVVINDDIYFDIFPNPARTHINLVLPDFASKRLPLQYSIRNVSGNNVQNGNITKLSQTINITSLPRGIYFISILDFTDKFIVE